jgi:spore germination protein KA
MKMESLPFFRKKRSKSGDSRTQGEGHENPKLTGDSFTKDLASNVQRIKLALGDSPDIVVREITDHHTGLVQMAFLYIDNLVDQQTVNEMILRPLMAERNEQIGESSTADRFNDLKNRMLPIGQVKESHTLKDAVVQILAGSTLILLQGHSIALAADSSGGEQRGVEEPTSQTVIRGPKESFTESIKTNLSLIRRRLKTPQLRIESKHMGKQTQTHVVIVYLEGIANDQIVKEVNTRLDRIDTDSILESGYIEEFIQDTTITPFPTIQNTERPDAAVAGILEGQIAIIVDGTPFVLLAPVTFIRFFQSSEDYYQRYDIASFLRIIRYISFFVSMLLPALFIAISTYHQEMLPTPLLISLAAQREGVPFPAIVEALLMEMTFEVLREAGVRMPKVIGPAISIVGALVLGQAAVQAGLVSAAMVIVVSFTAIANFVIPAIDMAIAARLIRFGMMFLAATLGLYGIMLGMTVLLIHMVGLRSFGVPYLTSLSPFVWSDWKDVFIRAPLWAMNKRPSEIASKNNRVRQGSGQKPAPPEQNPDT